MIVFTWFFICLFGAGLGSIFIGEPLQAIAFGVLSLVVLEGTKS